MVTDAGPPPMVTITVAVRNGVGWIDGCLEALVAQRHRPLEIVAVDDGSSDGGTATLEAWHDPTGARHGVPITVLSQGPLGLSAARMAALEAAKGAWVAITDIDCRPEPTWIEELMRTAGDGEDGERVVAVTGRTVFAEGDSIVGQVRAGDIRAKYASRPRRAVLANGPCSVFDRQCLLAVGGFDPTWYHAEDMEVSQRLLAAGGTILHAPSAVVHHVEEGELRVFLHKRRRDARAHVRIMRHWPRRALDLPGHDFIGRSSLILALVPLSLLWLALLLAGLGTAAGVVPETLPWWSLVAAAAAIWLIESFAAWISTPVAGLAADAGLPGRLLARIRLRQILRRWSWALIVGLTLGSLDALLGRHGHRPLGRAQGLTPATLPQPAEPS